MNARSTTAVSPTGSVRESFLAAQARHRAAARRWAVAMAAVVFAVTLVVSLLLAPLAFALIGLLADLVNLVVPAPNPLGALVRMVRAADEPGHSLPVATIFGLGVLAALPGFAVLAGAGARLGRIAAARDFDTVHATLGSRDLRSDDLRETQLGNVVAEMAIAAQHAPPRVQVIDSDACNLGVLGEGSRAALVVTRGLLDRIDRAQLEAVVADAVAALGNGDGLLAARMLRLDMTIGLLALLAHAAMEKPARRVLWRVLRMRGDNVDPDALRHVLGEPVPETRAPDAAARASRSTWRDWLMMPFIGSMLVGILIVPVCTLLLIAPLSGLMWRRRRLLADAMAVQFTRDPQALGEAWAAVAKLDTGLDLQRPWLGNLFVLDAGGAFNLSLGSPYPRLTTRVARLDAMGASVALPESRRWPVWLWALVLVLGAIVGGLLGLVVVLGAWLSLALNGLFLALPTFALHAALRALGH